MLSYIHIPKIEQEYHYQCGLQNFEVCLPPDATETEQSTHEKPEVDTAVTDRASPLPLHTHPTRKGPEETDGKRVLYMKLVANAF